jgi:hypothetical protein
MMADNIVTREDFIAFLSDFAAGSATWENNDLGSFLAAMKAWTEDMDGYYRNMGLPLPDAPNWRVFADILNGASIYE